MREITGQFFRYVLAELCDEAFHFFFPGQLDGIAGDENLVVQVSEGELDKGVILAGAKENADGRQVGLGHDIAGAEAEELEDVGIADDVGCLERVRSSVSHVGQIGFVLGEAAALEVKAGDLAAQLTNGPVSADALDLVEAALGVVW